MAFSIGKITPVILCGGIGTRLWPRSRASKPKPFLPLVGDETLFEQALLRCGYKDHFHAPVIVTGGRHLDHVRDQLGSAPDAQIIIEPESKNTAAAIALAAMRIEPDAVMLICPSDHHIGDREAFTKAALAAADLASEGWLVSFGIKAKAPDTGFGYLRRGEPIGSRGFKVEQFVEKPDLARAQAYVASGEYAWNGGIFAFAARDFLRELKHHRPEIYASVEAAVSKGHAERRRFYPDAEAFHAIKAESVDYAVMENTDRAAMVWADMMWSDIGNWQSLLAARVRDSSGNAVRGSAELVNCRNVLVDSDGPQVHAIGLEDVIIVVDGNDVVVTSADAAQNVGKLRAAANQ